MQSVWLSGLSESDHMFKPTINLRTPGSKPRHVISWQIQDFSVYHLSTVCSTDSYMPVEDGYYYRRSLRFSPYCSLSLFQQTKMALSPSHLWSMRKWLQPFGCWYIPYTLPRSWWQTASDFQLRCVSKTRWEAPRYSKSYLLSDKYKFLADIFTTDSQAYFLFPSTSLSISLFILFFLFFLISLLYHHLLALLSKGKSSFNIKNYFSGSPHYPWMVPASLELY